MAQVGFPRLYSIAGSSHEPRWDLSTFFPSSVSAMLSSKAANPNLLTLLHAQTPIAFPLPQITYGGSTYDAFGGATDTIVDGSAANMGVIRPYNATWDKLYNANGSLAGINNGTTGAHGWNLANYGLSIGIENTHRAFARFLVYRCKQNRMFRDGWNGYRSDNDFYTIWNGNFYGTNVDSNRNGVADTAGELRGRWGNGLNDLHQFVSQSLPGKIIGGNCILKCDPRESTAYVVYHADKNGWHKYPNLAEIEDGERYLYSHTMAQRVIDMVNSTSVAVDPTTGSSLSGFLNYPDAFGREKYATFMFQLANDSNIRLAVPANLNSPSVYKQEQYYKPARKGLALACCMGAYYFPLFDQQHHSRLYYDDEMLGGTNVNARNWMGQPVAAATSPATNVFLRQFEDGLAIVNVGSTNQTVTLPGSAGSWRKIAGTASHNDGAFISGTTFTIPAHDGRLLVREGVSPPIAQPPVNTVLPTLSGTAVSGQALTPTYGTWLNTPTSYSVVFARYSGGTRLVTLQTQSTLATYTLVAGDVGFTIRVEVVATNADGSSPTALSLATAVVQAPPEVEPSDVLGGPGSVIRDFTVGSESLPSSIFPASGIRDFALSPSIVGRLFKRIYGPALIPNLSTAFYTVLNGRRLIIRHIHVSNPSASPVDFTLAIGTDSPGTRLWDGQPVQADSILQHFRDHTLNEGETLLGFAGTNNVLTLTVDGYEESIDISQ